MHRIHQILGVNTLTVEVVLVLHPQFQDSFLLQALLTNLRVILPDELITQLNESAEGNASVGGYPAFGGQVVVRRQVAVGEQATVGEQVIVGVDESGEDALLSNYSDRKADNDDDVSMEFIEAEFDSAATPTIVDEGSDDSGDHERGQTSNLESDSDDNQSDANKEVTRLFDSPNDDVELDTV